MPNKDQELPWTQPGWFESASEWIHTQLERQGLRVTGPVELLHMRPWSSMARVPTTGGPVFFKAASPMLKHEPALTKALARWRPDCMLTVLAADFGRGWMLSADAGVMLRSLISPLDLGHWHKVLALYAEVQRDLTGRVSDLLALGTPDRRLAVLPRLYEQLLEDTDSLRVGLSPGLTPEEHRRLRDMRPSLSTLCERLADCGIPETIAHEEIHDANVLVSHGRYVFADWGESSVAHPFFTMLVTLRSAVYRLKLREDGPELARLRDIYLEPWRQFGSREKLVGALRLGYRLGMVNRALSWHRVLAPLSARDKGQEADAVSGWLHDFLETVEKAGG